MSPSSRRPSGLWSAGEEAVLLQLAIALATTLLLGIGWALRRSGRADAYARGRDGLLLAFGLAGGLGWWSPLLTDGYVHLHDGYHYFLGAKYFRELGYTRLYLCTVVADLEAGLGNDLEARRVRDLETNIVERGTRVVDDPKRCKEHFSSERWEQFAVDVAWFRARLPVLEWRKLQMDHGFNGTPAWLVAAAPLASFAGGAERWVVPLSLIDPLLLVLMWAGVAWAFGWRATCVAAVFWGTNAFADASWTAGSFLRQDWLAALVLGIAFLRRERAAVAGGLVTVSALLRIFPGFVAATLALKSGLTLMRNRTLRLPVTHARFAAGCVLVLALLVPLVTWEHGADAWTAFAGNSRKHLETPLLNQMGLSAVVSYDPASRASALENPTAADPYLAWKLAQRRHFRERWWMFAGVAAAYLALLLRSVRLNEDWVVLALGTGAIPIFTQLTCYYHAALLGLALLWARREAAGIALCGLAAASQAIALLGLVPDEAFVWMSVAEVLVVFYVTALFGSPQENP